MTDEQQLDDHRVASMQFRWVTFAALSAVALVDSAAHVPFGLENMRANDLAPPDAPDWVLACVLIAVLMVLAEAGILVGLLLAKMTGLARSAFPERSHRNPPTLGDLMRRLGCAAAAGGSLGLVSLTLAWLLLVRLRLVPEFAPDEELGPVWWKAALLSVSSGVVEELVFRLGVMTLFAWAGSILTRRWPAGKWVVWASLLLSSILFAVAHLGNVGTITPGLAVTIIAGNTSGGLLFGWLYWRHGIEAAILAHICADLVLKVLGPAVSVTI